VNVATDSGHAARRTTKTAADPSEAFGERLYQGSSDRIDNNCNESFESEHGRMMALAGLNVKTGKHGCPAILGEVALFSCLFNFKFSR
jgi:hypothetical protein